MNLPIHRRESAFKINKDVFNTKLGKGEIDFYKPRRETLAQWVSDCEKRMGKLRLHPHWGSACSPHGLGGTTDWNADTKIELQEGA